MRTEIHTLVLHRKFATPGPPWSRLRKTMASIQSLRRGGGVLCTHRHWIMQCTIMHNYAQLCTIMHNAFQRRHKGIANKSQDPGIANLLSFGSRPMFLIFRRQMNFIVLQSIFSSGNMCKCILVDKIVHDKHNNELH